MTGPRLERDWVIVGGGLHGVHVATSLLRAGLPPEKLAIVDKEPTLLSRWFRVTAAVVGMEFLRSPIVHHLGASPNELWDFAQDPAREPIRKLLPPYNQPGLELFQAHARTVVERHDLAKLHVEAEVEGLEQQAEGGWHLQTGDGPIVARHVVLSPGASPRLRIPGWAEPLVRDGLAEHVFHPGFVLPNAGRVVVVGAGISAGQVALGASAQGLDVTLLTTQPIAVRNFDVDASWMGPRRLRAFRAAGGPEARRALMGEGRFPGSMPHEIRLALREQEADGRVRHVVAKQVEARMQEDRTVLIRAADIDDIAADRVLLCTGLIDERPGGALVDALADAGLPTAPCGYPVLDETLAWTEGLHLTGRLAELELGPAAPNLLGARWAARRIVDALLASRR